MTVNCPVCRVGKMKSIMHKRRFPTLQKRKEQAVMTCVNCHHKEVFN